MPCTSPLTICDKAPAACARQTNNVIITDHNTLHTQELGAQAKKEQHFRRMMPNIHQGRKTLRKTQQKPALKQQNRTHNEHNMRQHELLSTCTTAPTASLDTNTAYCATESAITRHRTKENTLDPGRGGRCGKNNKIVGVCVHNSS